MAAFPSLIDLSAFESIGYGFTVQGDVAGDLAGWSASSAGDVNGDGIADLIVGAPGTDAAYVIFGLASPVRTRIDLSSLSATDGFAIFGANAGDDAGSSVASAGDVNGDGIADLIVGAPLNDDGGTDAGKAYVIFGLAGATRADIYLSALAATDGFSIQGDAAEDNAGGSVSAAGDINGDGIADFIVGAAFGDDTDTNAGEAYVIFGKAGATRLDIDLSTLASTDGFVIRGPAGGKLAGSSVSAAGDVNGDGTDDLIVGVPEGSGIGAGPGSAVVIFGKSGATRTDIDLAALASADGFAIFGDADSDQAGISVSAAGDVNGDGIADLVIGAFLGDDGGIDAGEAYVVFGLAQATRPDIDLSTLAATDGFVIVGDAADERLGISVSGGGDVDGDGVADLIVGAFLNDTGGNNAGKAYVIKGVAGATRSNIDLSTLSASDGFAIQGDAANDLAGFSVSVAGDVNGDGRADILIGAPAGDDGGPNAGEAYVIFGRGVATILGDNLVGLNLDDTIDLLAGDDVYRGLAGNDTITGGRGVDSLYGEAGDDIFVVRAGHAASGELYDGGSDDDMLSVEDGGTVDISRVRLVSVESITSDRFDTTLVVANQAMGLLVTDMQGRADVLRIASWTGGNYDLPTLRDLLTGRGIETVEWSQGINAFSTSLNSVTGHLDMEVTDLGSRPHDTIVNSYERDFDLRRQVITYDDGAVATTDYDASGIIASLEIDASAAVPARSYTSLVNTYTGGLLDLSVLTGNDGVTTTKDYDASGPASVLLTSVREDVLDAFAWDRIVETYDASGALTQRLSSNDAGENVASIEMNYASGLLADRLITYADGRTSETTFSGGAVVLTRNTAVNGDQTVIGGAGDDTIVGGDGNDLLLGGAGNDVFEFSGVFGNDRISGFADGQDRLDLTAYSIDAFDDIAGNGFGATQVGKNTVIDLGANGTITLLNFQIAGLDDADFFS